MSSNFSKKDFLWILVAAGVLFAGLFLYVHGSARLAVARQTQQSIIDTEARVNRLQDQIQTLAAAAAQRKWPANMAVQRETLDISLRLAPESGGRLGEVLHDAYAEDGVFQLDEFQLSREQGAGKPVLNVTLRGEMSRIVGGEGAQ